MGCGYSKDHPKNANLAKLRKKYDKETIKKAKLINIWVIGANKTKTLALSKLISEKLGYLLLTEDSLLQTEMDAESARGKIIKEIVEDKGTVCPGMILDLVSERILEKLSDIKGLVFHGIPRNRDEACNLQKQIGHVDLIVFCELKGEDLKEALTQEGEEASQVKSKVEHFQKSVLQLAKHKNAIKVDGTLETESLIEEIELKITSLPK